MEPLISFNKLDKHERKRLGIPVAIIGGLACIGFILYAIFADLSRGIRILDIGSSILGFLYILAYYYVILPNMQQQWISHWLFVIFNGLLTGWIFFIEPFSVPISGFLIFSLLLLGCAVLVGRLPTYLYIVVSLASIELIPLMTGLPATAHEWSLPIIFILLGVGTNETIDLMKRDIDFQIRRLEVVNQMTRSLAYSIEVPQVVSLMSSAIQAALDADTYYIGLVNGNDIELQLLYDDGDFYPLTTYPMENTVAGWVVKNHRSLFMTDVPNQLSELGLSINTIGKPRLSQSFMGVPLQMGDHFIGIAAVASYQSNAFTHKDLELLENFAQQAAISLDNAYHHAEVERKSTLDSLTNVLNHGHFIKVLAAEAEKAHLGNYPLALIMLDIDHFKRYNDTYGHLVGDQVLVGMCEMIKSNIKNTDLVGRWGGEEFAVALRQTDAALAARVANRIRASVSRLQLTDRAGEPILPPTISQGVAILPAEADQIFTLIDLADQRLYIAKERGRDQIELPPICGQELVSAAITDPISLK